MSNFWKWFALVFVLSLVYFYPGWIPGHTFVMTDFLTSSYPFWKLASLKFPPPKWEPFVFGGLPFWGAPHADSFYPINQLLRMLTTPGHAAALTLFLHSLLGFTFAWLYLRSIGLKGEWAGALGILYAFGLFWTSMVYSGHIAKMVITAYIPAVFWALEGTLKGSLKYAALLGLFGGLIIVAHHVQIVYYVGIVAIIYGFSYLIVQIKRRNYRHALKVFLLGLMAIAIALMIGAPFLLPQYEYITKFSVRGETKSLSFSKTWSLDWADFVSVFFGLYSGVFETYWGSNPFKINTEYMGAVLGFLGIVGAIVGVKSKNWRPVSLVASALLLMTFMTAKVNILFHLFHAILPGLKLFRAQSMAAIPLGFVALALAGHAFLNFEESKRLMPKVLMGGVVVAVLIFLLGPNLALRQGSFAFNPKILEIFDATGGDRLFVLLRTLGVWGLVWGILKNQEIKVMTAALTLALLGYGESFFLKGKFIKPIDETQHFAPDDVALYLKEHPGIYRILDFGYRPEDNYLALFGVQFVGGHHGQQMQSYQEYLGCKALMFNPFNCERLINHFQILDSINTRYILAPVGIKEAARQEAENRANPILQNFADYIAKYEEVFNNERISILFNPDHFPRFYGQCGDSVVPAKVKAYDYINGYYEAEIEAPSQCKFVLTENWYPHWHAFLDGKPVSIERYKGTFMAFNIPQGRHLITFTYDSPLERLGLQLYAIGFALVIAITIFGLWRDRVK
ncbi:MAG: YfhO family protein [Thermotogae bacterium]|nr:YfhO family protein [Thermotogota bacterium]